MTEDKQKTKAGFFLQKIIAPFVRGTIKSIPFIGTPIAEIITNWTLPNTVAATSTEGKSVEVYTGNKHNYISIIIQITIGISMILDLILNKGNNLKMILDLVGLLPK